MTGDDRRPEQVLALRSRNIQELSGPATFAHVRRVGVVSRPVGGVLFAAQRRSAGVRGGHPSKRPTWGHRTGSPSPFRPCSGWGLPSRPGHPGRWCALTAPFHPCLCGRSPPSAVCSLWHFPSSRPDWPLASTLPCGAPTFLSCSLSGGTPRPPGRLTVLDSRTKPDRRDPLAPGVEGRVSWPLKSCITKVECYTDSKSSPRGGIPG
jgi:hypothetical protein